MLHEHGAPLEGLGDEVTVGNGAHGVPQDTLEAQLLGHHVAVDAEGVTSKGTAAERASVDALDNLTEALEVVGEGEAVGEHPVAPADGLSALQVGVPGHDVIDLALGTGSRQLQEAGKLVVNLAELVAEPHAHVADDLLVAAAAGVELAGDILANDLAESALVGCVNVLVDAGDDGEGASLPLVLDLEKTLLELLKLLLGDDAVLGVGAGKGDAAKDVLLVEHTIEEDALVVLDHKRIEATGESTTPEHAALWLGARGHGCRLCLRIERGTG